MTEAQMDKCRGEGFVEMPKVIRTDRSHIYCECPFCESSDHAATIALGGLEDARPIHCHVSGRMGWVLFVSGVLSAEESRFRALLGKWDDPEPMSADDACIAWHSKGLPYEIAEEIADDPDRFRELAEAHRAKSQSVKTVF